MGQQDEKYSLMHARQAIIAAWSKSHRKRGELTQTSTEPQRPTHGFTLGRRPFVIGGVGAAGYLFLEGSIAPVLRMLFPPSIENPETDIHAQDKITISQEQLRNGIQLVTCGDSISRGFQGYSSATVQTPSTENPPTPATQAIVDRLRYNGIIWPDAKIYAQPGATSSQVVEQVVMFIRDAKTQVAAAIKSGKKPRPYIVELGEHGNEDRTIVSQVANYAEVRQIKEQGLLNVSSILSVGDIQPDFQDTVLSNRNNDLLCLLLLKQAALEGVPIIGVLQRLPYPFDNIPKIEFIPMAARNHAEQILLQKNGIVTQVFYPRRDKVVQLGMHDVSYGAYWAAKDARKQYDNCGPSPFPVPLNQTAGLEGENNGTEHLSPKGNRDVGYRDMKHIRVAPGGQTLDKITPKIPPLAA